MVPALDGASLERLQAQRTGLRFRKRNQSVTTLIAYHTIQSVFQKNCILTPLFYYLWTDHDTIEDVMKKAL